MKSNKNEKGMVIVEASIVFPVMFLAIFLMIVAGNAYLQMCRVEAIVSEMAIDGASYCADPMLDDIEESGVPALGSEGAKTYPYRYVLDDEMKNVEAEIKSQIEEKVGGLSTGLFSGMKPSSPVIAVDFNNYFIYSTFAVDIEYDIIMPVRMLWESDYISLAISTRTDMPVSDSTEFIRNVDMAEDYMERTGAMEKIQKAIKEVREMVGF